MYITWCVIVYRERQERKAREEEDRKKKREKKDAEKKKRDEERKRADLEKEQAKEEKVGHCKLYAAMCTFWCFLIWYQFNQ